MPVLILDPMYERHVRAIRKAEFPDARDEVWEGVLVVPPLPNNEHQILATELAFAFGFVVNRPRGDKVLVGCNVSDRDEDWTQNYREPDVAVYLSGNAAKDSSTHWVGGPDFLVEIVSPGEDARQKLDFYARVNTIEVLIVERHPWRLELYRLQNGKLALIGVSDLTNSAVLASAVLPLTFQIGAAARRPAILVSHTASSQTWTA